MGSSAPLLGLQFVIVNAGNNADSVPWTSLGGSFVSLFDNGNLGGAGGVGLAQRVVGNLTVSILSGGAARERHRHARGQHRDALVRSDWHH